MHDWFSYVLVCYMSCFTSQCIYIQSTPHRIVIKINHASRLSNLTFEFEFGKKHHCEWSWIMSVCQHSCYSRDYITYSTIMCHCTNFVIEICLSRRLTCNVILFVVLPLYVNNIHNLFWLGYKTTCFCQTPCP